MKLPLFLGRIVCKMRGHKRGRRLLDVTPDIAHFECPRCHAHWTRKQRTPRVKP